MPAEYGCSSSSIDKNKASDNVEIRHNHTHHIGFETYGIKNRSELRSVISKEKALLKGCISFFKTYAEDKTVDIAIRAAANAAVQEDETRLKEYEKHEPSSCNML